MHYRALDNRIVNEHGEPPIKMKNNTLTPTSLIASGLLILLCAWALLFAGKWLVAEYYANKVNDQIELWDSYGDIYFLEEWEAALDNINRAVVLHENSAELHRLKGFLHEWRRVAPYPEDDDLNPMQKLRQTIQIQTDARQSALSAYRDSLALRPAWPQVWLKVANLKGALDEFDEEFYNAVERSYDYGRNLDFVQDNLTELSVRYFEEIQMREDLKGLQLDHLAKSLNRGRVHVDLVNRFRLMATLCGQLLENGYLLTGAAARNCEQALQ